MDINYLYYLTLFRKNSSTSLCVRYSKSGSGTLFVPMSELFSPEGILTMTQVPSATYSSFRSGQCDEGSWSCMYDLKHQHKQNCLPL